MMGAWGSGNLENDTVLDWVAELLEIKDLNRISEAIEMVLDEDDIDADTASIGIGAIEILAALQGNTGKEKYEDELEVWISEHKGFGHQLLDSARLALKKILADSELKELWEESDHYEDWIRAIKELEGRVS
ncbi:DUF4259 domain-containing protein [Paenibacillus sp. PL2-23]|uniref:DUF4259 domain-containing protein n=1 Tax=Paenibacillus sp. PL2-23 TaxID=2100729 RepID=UPI0030F67ACA